MQKSAKAGMCLAGLLMIPVTACGDMQQKAPTSQVRTAPGPKAPSKLLKSLEQSGRTTNMMSAPGSICY